jgi:hypothetical protein
MTSRHFDWNLVAYRRQGLPSARNLLCTDDLSQKLHIGERIATEINKIINVEISRSCNQPTRYWGHVLWKSIMASVHPWAVMNSTSNSAIVIIARTLHKP